MRALHIATERCSCVDMQVSASLCEPATEKNIRPGMRCRRGPHWSYGNQDDGPSNHATVIGFCRGDGRARGHHLAGRPPPPLRALVQWDGSNMRGVYSIGQLPEGVGQLDYPGMFSHAEEAPVSSGWNVMSVGMTSFTEDASTAAVLESFGSPRTFELALPGQMTASEKARSAMLQQYLARAKSRSGEKSDEHADRPMTDERRQARRSSPLLKAHMAYTETKDVRRRHSSAITSPSASAQRFADARAAHAAKSERRLQEEVAGDSSDEGGSAKTGSTDAGSAMPMLKKQPGPQRKDSGLLEDLVGMLSPRSLMRVFETDADACGDGTASSQLAMESLSDLV